MVEKIKDAANLLKAKITKDQLEQTLVQITSEENWQASTHLLHEIANAAYNYEKWQKINEFIWDKLKKSKSWRKILKSLALVQFLLKNGPSSVVSCYKYDIYQFRTFDSYTLYSEGTDRGEPIREKSKSIVQLLSNEELLQDERVKAKTIRERMSGVLGSGIKYNSYTGNNSYDTYETQNKYGQQNQSWGKNGYYANYQQEKPTIDKYKNKSTTITKVTGNNSTGENQVKTDQNDDKKPFQRLAPKLSKPGDKKPKQQIEKKEKIETKNTKNTNINIFEDVTQNTAHFQTNELYKQQEKLIQQEKEKLHKQQEQFLFKQQQQQQQIKQQQEQIKQQQMLMEQQKMQQMQQSLQGGVNTGQQLQYNQMNAQNYSIGPNNGQMNQYNGQNYNAQNVYLGTQQQQMNFQTSPPPPQQTNQIGNQTASFMQNNIRINPMYPTTIPMASQQTQQASLSLQTKKQDEQFGGFQSAQTQNVQNVQWLSKEQKGLIDFSDFGAQIKQSNQPQVKKKNKENGNGVSVDVWNW